MTMYMVCFFIVDNFFVELSFFSYVLVVGIVMFSWSISIGLTWQVQILGSLKQ